VVDEGVILITPGIFQDFALSHENDKSKWGTIQKKVLKKNWHFRDKQGLNVVKYQVKGQKKLTTVNTILFHDVSLVFGSMEPPTSNPHLLKID
jgi:conjugal transfer pilus assembly protein TraI